ncbi:MAG: PP2C family protein-serine/threonine phosphatase, partial [Terracidiphilus sp.]
VTLGQDAVPLYGPWKFTIGDSPIDSKTGKPLWAEPDFDDSRWETVDLTPKTMAIDPTSGWTGYVPGWTARGHRGYWGYAWYRIRVQEQEFRGEESQRLALWDVDDAYQIFADGRQIGAFGGFRRGKPPVTYWNEPEMFDLPEQRIDGNPNNVSVTHVLAFRIWCGPNTLTQNPDGGGLHVAPVIGNAAAVGAQHQNAWFEIVRSYGASVAELLIYFVLAIAACSLVFFDHSDQVYLWLAGVFLLTAANAACICVFAWTTVADQVTMYLITDAFFAPLILGGWVMTWWFWFRLRGPSLVPKVVVGLTLLYGLSFSLGEDLFFTLIPHAVGAALHLASIGIRLSLLGVLILIVVQGIRQQGREGWLALPAVVLVGIAQFQIDLLVLHVRTVWFPFGVGVYLYDIANAVLSVVIFVLLLRRLQQSLHRQRLIALDLKQAQEVQQVILPESRVTLPSFTVESEYRPAREVGGDFFQIIPHKTDGSLLIVAGDVTGKGLKAGMLVALLVGAIRTEEKHNNDPVGMLSTLNQRLIGRGDAQATCLAMRIDADGSAMLANAGHLAPYLNGDPLAMEGALPLGIIEGAESSVMHFQLEKGDRLILMSDGIAEATDADGHLFGFESVNELLRTAKSVTEIAGAAQAFGQDDDITVILVTRTAGLEAAAA